MAVTKTHPIKSTLKAAIDYICNPEKTDGKLLVSSYGCAAETADIEFAWTRRHAIDKGTSLERSRRNRLMRSAWNLQKKSWAVNMSLCLPPT